MLTELRAYSSWQSAPTLPLLEAGREETDLIQIRGIDGLDPVKATVNTSPFGSVDGAAFTGASVLTRNIVLTLHPNPDYKEYSFTSLRRLLYSYFMPKLLTRLVFYSDDMPPVEIYGYVEDCNVNPFVKDLEISVSIICPDPYFTAIDATVITGLTNDAPVSIDYEGSVEAGINVEVLATADPVPNSINVKLGAFSYFSTKASVNPNMYFIMNSVPGQKYVQNVAMGSGLITNLLSKMENGSQWLLLQPGSQDFSVVTDVGRHDWSLSYFARYGGL